MQIRVHVNKSSGDAIKCAVEFMELCDSILEEGDMPEGYTKGRSRVYGQEKEAFKILENTYSSSCMARVVYGYQALVDPANKIVDHKSGVLELHPRITSALEATTLHPIETWEEHRHGNVIWWHVEKGEPMLRCLGHRPFDWQSHDYTHFSLIPKVELPEKEGD